MSNYVDKFFVEVCCIIEYYMVYYYRNEKYGNNILKNSNKVPRKGGYTVMDFTVNIIEVIENLENEWMNSSSYKNNPTAFTKKKIDEHNIMMCCPYHNENKPSFGITTSYPYMFNCFSCGESGKLVSLVSYVYGISYLAAYKKILTQYSEYDLSLFNNAEIEEDAEEVTEEEIFNYRRKKHSYIENRGISDHTIQKYEIGYDEDNYAITFPVRDLYNNPSFIIRRSVTSKYYNIPKGSPKKETLYGLNYLYGKTDTVYIAEGPIDVLSCYEAGLPAIGLMGRTLSKTQLKLLQLAGINRVILFLDNDKWGILGNLDAYKLLSTTPIKVEVAQYPMRWGVDKVDGIEYKDPNDLLRKELIKDIKIVSFLEFYYSLLQSKYSREVLSNGNNSERA